MRSVLVFLLLYLIRVTSRTFYRIRENWVGEPVEGDPWSDLRVTVVLNHTSLFEWLWAGTPPPRYLWQIARHGVIPVASVTLERPLIGWFFHFIGRHVVSISRERDHTWSEVMQRIDDPKAMIVLAPEGRMMRQTGLDKHGKPMTVRGGIADILEAIPEGRMLIAYSEGLHHVQKPGEHLPRLFQTLRIHLETVDIATYRRQIQATAEGRTFKRAVARDLEHRRDRYCWPDPSQHPRALWEARQATGQAAPAPGDCTD